MISALNNDEVVFFVVRPCPVAGSYAVVCIRRKSNSHTTERPSARPFFVTFIVLIPVRSFFAVFWLLPDLHSFDAWMALFLQISRGGHHVTRGRFPLVCNVVGPYV